MNDERRVMRLVLLLVPVALLSGCTHVISIRAHPTVNAVPSHALSGQTIAIDTSPTADRYRASAAGHSFDLVRIRGSVDELLGRLFANERLVRPPAPADSTLRVGVTFHIEGTFGGVRCSATARCEVLRGGAVVAQGTGEGEGAFPVISNAANNCDLALLGALPQAVDAAFAAVPPLVAQPPAARPPVAAPAAACTPPCRSGFQCSPAGDCVPIPAQPVCNPPCPQGQRCTGDACVPESPPPRPAPSQAECFPACRRGYVCSGGTCVPEQSGATTPAPPPTAAVECVPACRSGFTCERGTCVQGADAPRADEKVTLTPPPPASNGLTVTSPPPEPKKRSKWPAFLAWGLGAGAAAAGGLLTRAHLEQADLINRRTELHYSIAYGEYQAGQNYGVGAIVAFVVSGVLVAGGVTYVALPDPE